MFDQFPKGSQHERGNLDRPCAGAKVVSTSGTTDADVFTSQLCRRGTALQPLAHGVLLISPKGVLAKGKRMLVVWPYYPLQTVSSVPKRRRTRSNELSKTQGSQRSEYGSHGTRRTVVAGRLVVMGLDRGLAMSSPSPVPPPRPKFSKRRRCRWQTPLLWSKAGLGGCEHATAPGTTADSARPLLATIATTAGSVTNPRWEARQRYCVDRGECTEARWASCPFDAHVACSTGSKRPGLGVKSCEEMSPGISMMPTSSQKCCGKMAGQEDQQEMPVL